MSLVSPFRATELDTSESGRTFRHVMRVSESTLKALEYTAWREILAEFARTEPGRETIRALCPLDDLEAIKERLESTREVEKLVDRQGDLPIEEFGDIRERVGQAAIEGFILDPEDFFGLWSVLRSGRLLRTRIRKSKDPIPRLQALAETIVPQKYLEDVFDQTFDRRGNVKDSASKELGRIRKELKRLQERIERLLQGILDNPKNVKVFNDTFMTKRNGRYVLPVNNDQKGKIKGIVHHASSSGATVFLEPLSVVEDNNALDRLEDEERREIRRILQYLSQSVGGHKDEIIAMYDALVAADVYRAQAAMSKKHGLNIPTFQSNREVMLIGARHPILMHHKGKDGVVPIDVSLGSRYQLLVITGPNTGGKTVALKTVGLLTLIAHTGCPIAAEESSVLPLLTSLHADIGDDQDLVGSLSTFSAHMVKVRSILREADSKALVLLDELGTGTDPAEGSALGIAILRQLHERKALVMATTHHEPLKAFAYAEEFAENGSVEFDPKTLRPTYRLITGIPGESNAFHIAENLQLPIDVIIEARRIKEQGFGSTSQLLLRLERDTREISEAKAEFQDKMLSARKLQERAETTYAEKQSLAAQALEKAHMEAKSILEDARHKAQFLVDRTRRRTDELLREAEERATEAKADETANLDDLQGEIDAAKSEADDHNELAKAQSPKSKRSKKKTKKLRQSLTMDDIAVGKRYKLLNLNKEGTAASVDMKRGQISMQVKGMVVKVTPDQLGLVDPTEILKEDKRERGVVFEGVEGDRHDATLVQRETPNWLNIRGKRVEEALDLVEQYLDQALLTRMPQVTVLHGTGTGALKEAVRTYLRELDIVEEIRDGEQWEGGHGVTVVTLAS